MGLLRKPVLSRHPGRRLAIFSLHHSVIGKATQKRPRTAAAHVRYITRPSACSRSFGARLPTAPAELTLWFNTQEAADRSNGRVCDKLMLALPRELDAAQRAALVAAYAEEITRQRASWFVAVHDKGKDAQNPHCHVVIRDRDPDTGKRVINTSERGSTDLFRARWAAHCNRALEAAQRQERVSHLSLAAQGIERTPTVHEGVRARRAQARGRPPRSRPINARNAATARSRSRVIDYPALDQGTSRATHNAQIVRQNERSYWAAIDAEQARQARDAAVREQHARAALAVARATPTRPGAPEAARDGEGRSPPPSSPAPGGGFDRAAWQAKRQASRDQGRDPTATIRTSPPAPRAAGFDREAWTQKRQASRERGRGRDDD